MQNAISYMLGQSTKPFDNGDNDNINDDNININEQKQFLNEQTQRTCSLNAALCFAKNNILEYYYKSSNILTTEQLLQHHHHPLTNVSLIFIKNFVISVSFWPLTCNHTVITTNQLQEFCFLFKGKKIFCQKNKNHDNNRIELNGKNR